jgi:predicted nucleic-acid-binding Zn-ribbon protein
MKLTDDEIKNYIAEKADFPCPMCRSEIWDITGDNSIMIIGTEARSLMRFIGMFCAECGYTNFFQVKKLLEWQSKKEATKSLGEKNE